MSHDQLTKLLVGAKIKVSQFSNKDYRLELAGGLKGGGIGGANVGFSTGKFVTHLTFQKGRAVKAFAVNFVIPGSGIPFAFAAEKVLAPIVETTSNAVAISCALAGEIAIGYV